MEQTDTLLDIYLDDMLEDLKENRHDEIIHLWLTKVRENDELRYFYQDEDMAIIDLCNFFMYRIATRRQNKHIEAINFTLLSFVTCGQLRVFLICFCFVLFFVLFCFLFCFFTFRW